MLELGAVLQDRYRIECVLGKGGTSVVYLARHQVIEERLVAIKEVLLPSPESEARAQVIAQFNREAQLLASLHHASLVTVSDFFSQDDALYLVMKYIEGQTLDKAVASMNGQVPPRIALKWAIEICDVLCWLHTRTPPVIYRDLKPSNLVLGTHDERIYLLDFGIAREVSAGSVTHTWLKGIGTPGYAPPEQFGAGTTDPRSDIYALGATLYAVLTGRRPPVSVDLMAASARIIPPTRLNPTVSAALERSIYRMMALRKEERYQRMEDVREALVGLEKEARTATIRVIPSTNPGTLTPPATHPHAHHVPRSATAFHPARPLPPPAPTTRPRTDGALQTEAEAVPPEIPSLVTPPDPGVQRRIMRDWKQALAGWVACLAVWTLALTQPHLFGPLFLPAMLAYPVGHVLGLPFGPPLSLLGGTLAAFSVPLGLAGWMTWKQRPFWTLFCLHCAADGIVTIGAFVCVAGNTVAHDWQSLLSLRSYAQTTAAGNAMHLVGVIALSCTLYMMGALLWRTFPTRKVQTTSKRRRGR